MKKMIAVLALIGILFTVGGCSKVEPAVSGELNSVKLGYTILEVGGGDSVVTGAQHNQDISLKREYTAESKESKEKTITHHGVEYQVTYEETIKDYYFNDEVRRYVKRNGRNSVEFEVNTKTGRVDGYWWYEEDYLNNPNLEKKSRNECLTVARDYLASYIDDPEAYELVEESFEGIPEYEAQYDFCFARMINGVRTADFARIRVTIHGIVWSHVFDCFGEMKGAQLPDKEEMTTIQEDVEKKLDTIYESVKEKYDVSYELTKMRFVRLADGRYALDFNYDVELLSLASENVFPIKEPTRLLVVLEDT